MKEHLSPFFRKLLDLKEGADEKQVIIEKIKDDADFSSARFWTLVFAIGVASVGLNINSIPVVIGAMLISPLMGPIVSMGMALSIYDWGLMRRSFRNLMLLTVISIVISSLYFALSPIPNAQSELLARIQPTIFDVIIAIFGGMAGFIGLTRERHNNVIPGVAIATALMPPLCTVGYGIGTLQPKFIFGASFLFLINCIFICLSALVVASYLKLPKREYPDAVKRKRVNRVITAIIVLIVTPAVYFAYSFVEQNNFRLNANKFVQEVFEDRGFVIIHEDISFSPTKKMIELAFLDERFSDDQLGEFRARMADFGLENTELSVRQNSFSLTEEEWQSVLSEVQDDAERVRAVEAKLESERMSFQSPARLLSEAEAINEKIINIALGSLDYGVVTNEEQGDVMVALVYTATTSAPLKAEEASVVAKWLEKRLEKENVLTYFIPEVQVLDGDNPAPEQVGR